MLDAWRQIDRCAQGQPERMEARELFIGEESAAAADEDAASVKKNLLSLVVQGPRETAIRPLSRKQRLFQDFRGIKVAEAITRIGKRSI